MLDYIALYKLTYTAMYFYGGISLDPIASTSSSFDIFFKCFLDFIELDIINSTYIQCIFS